MKKKVRHTAERDRFKFDEYAWFTVHFEEWDARAEQKFLEINGFGVGMEQRKGCWSIESDVCIKKKVFYSLVHTYNPLQFFLFFVLFFLCKKRVFLGPGWPYYTSFVWLWRTMTQWCSKIQFVSCMALLLNDVSSRHNLPFGCVWTAACVVDAMPIRVSACITTSFLYIFFIP